MKYRWLNSFDIKALKDLYNDVGWVSYTKDLEKFEHMFKHSLGVYAAFNKENLVGLIRVVGDGVHILYIQDILVHEDYQRQGVATKLMQGVIDKYKTRQTVLITDQEDQKSNAFYKAIGFKKSETLGINCYLKFQNI